MPGRASASPSASASSSAKPLDTPQTVAQMKSKKFQAAQYGFELDVFVIEKSSEEVKIFKICDISDTEVGVVEQIDGEDAEGRTIDIDEFLHGWRLYKGKVTTKLPGWSSALCTPSQSEAWVLDGARGAVALAVRSEWMSHTRHLDELDIFLHPVTVRLSGNKNEKHVFPTFFC